MLTHEQRRTTSSEAGGARESRAGGGATAGRLPARSSRDLPAEAPAHVQEALAVQLRRSAATQYGFETDPFGLGADGTHAIDETGVARGGPPVQRRESRAEMPAPSIDRFAPKTPERDAPRRLDDLERVTGKMRRALPGMMNARGRAELQALAVQGRALRDVLAEMERAGLLRASGLEDRFVEARTHFENLEAKLPPADEPPVTESHDRPLAIDTGIPMIDEGMYCEREGHETDVRCTLIERDRTRLQGLFAERVAKAHGNFVAAVTLQKVEEMTKRTNNWGFMAELVFGIASLAVGSALMEIGKRVAALPRPKFPGVDPSSMVKIEQMPMEGVNPEHVLLGWKQMSSGIRNVVRSSVNGHTPGQAGRLAFLDALAASVGTMSQTVSEQTLVVMNDQEAVALYHAYDIKLHDAKMYKTRIEELMTRFEAQKIDDIGEELEHDFGRREIVQLKYRGRLRRAMVAKDDAQPVDWAKRAPRFISWVDATFGEYADQVQRSRAGDVEIVDLDPWDPMKKSPSSPIDGGISDEVLEWMRTVDKEVR